MSRVYNFSAGPAVLPEDLLLCYERIGDKRAAVEIFPVQIDRCQTAIIIGGIIIDAAVCIAAGGIDRALVLPVCHLAAAALLLYRAENMEKLANAVGFVIF